MEKVSFESSLQKIVLQADENASQASGKERVWKGVKTNKQSKKWWAYAAAVVLVFSLSIALFSTRKDRTEVKLVKKANQPRENSLKAAPIDRLVLPKSKVQETPQKVLVKVTTVVDTLTTLPSQQIPEPPLLIVKETVVAMVPKPVAASSTTNEKAIPQPEFSVQFKRGKPIETLAEKQIKTAATFKKLSFVRDTSTFANLPVKADHSLKIKF